MRKGSHYYDERHCENCGKQFWARRDSIKRGMGRFCGHKCHTTFMHKSGVPLGHPGGPTHHWWQGGRFTDKKGYVWVLREHASIPSCNYALEHRVVAEEKLGRLLESDEVVHHIDGNPSNNDPDNLEVMTRGEHTAHHLRERYATD